MVSLNRLINWPMWAGMTLRSACGSTMSTVWRIGDSPSALAASYWPLGTDCNPPRTISAMYAAVNRVNTADRPA